MNTVEDAYGELAKGIFDFIGNKKGDRFIFHLIG